MRHVFVPALTILLCAGILYALLRLATGRSLTANLAALFLRVTKYRKRFTDPDACDAYIAQRSSLNERPFSLPEKFHSRAPLDALDFDGMPLYIFNREADGGPVILYAHGGAYVNRPQIRHWKFLSQLAKKTGARLYAPLYPLAPAHTAPEAFARMQALYDEILRTNLGKPVILMGDSSGGGLVTALCARPDARQPDQLILLSPWVDVEMNNPALRDFDTDPLCGLYGLKKIAKLWAGETSLSDPMVSPIHGDLSVLRRVSVFTGTKELLYPDIKRFVAALPDATLYERRGVTHAYPLYPTLEAKKAVRQICALIHQNESCGR